MAWPRSDWLAPQMAALKCQAAGWTNLFLITPNCISCFYFFSLFRSLFGTAAEPTQQAIATGYTSLARGANTRR